MARGSYSTGGIDGDGKTISILPSLFKMVLCFMVTMWDLRDTFMLVRSLYGFLCCGTCMMGYDVVYIAILVYPMVELEGVCVEQSWPLEEFCIDNLKEMSFLFIFLL
jgi:hypothetical protein